MEISYSMSIGGTDDAPPPEPALWAFCGVDLMPAPEHAVLLRRLDDDRRHFVRTDVAAALDHCRHFATLNDHAVAVGDVVPELKGKPEAAMPVLKQMAEIGFLRRADELLQRLKQTSPVIELRAPKVFIITCDRPDALRRLLVSLAEHSDNSEFEITVIDDSRKPENLKANAEAVNHAPRLQVDYFGMAERETLIDQLVHRLPEHETSIRFLIDRARWPGLPTYGLARNLALLLSVGERLIVLDDDILAQAIPSPDAKPTLAFGSVNDRRMAFWKDQQSMLAGNPMTSASPLALVSDVLGKTLGQIASPAPLGAYALAGAKGDDWLEMTSDATVIKTQCGTYGDPGTGNKAHWVINLPPDDIERLLAAGPSIEDTLDARAVWMGYRQPTVMRFGSMAAVTGMDQRESLPPYLPVLRGEDFLFAVMLEKLRPQDVVMGCPWAVPHLPLEQRGKPSFEGSMGTAELSSQHLALWLAEALSPVTPGSATPLTRIAAAIEALAKSENLEGLTRHVVSKRHLQLLEQTHRGLGQQLGQSLSTQRHTEWQRILKTQQQQLNRALLKPIVDGQLGNASMAALQASGMTFAASLASWPTVTDAARDLG